MVRDELPKELIAVTPSVDLDGDVEVLQGGVANAGAVFRVGDKVSRPANPRSAIVHRFLGHLRRRGLEIAPEPLALPDEQRELLRFIPGDVPIPPFPLWAQTDTALTSIAVLLRAMHDASLDFPAKASDTWSPEMADFALDGPVICHNDVCLENVVFRDGVAIALLDFDFAA